ncbi:MAG TPA: SPOR domain-containing protein, partial [Burkholderiales bacterium]
LVGAIALVLLAVIVLPWIFDPQPRQAPPVSVRIPGEDEKPFVPKNAPKPPAPPAKAEKPSAAPQAEKPAPSSAPAVPATPKAGEKPVEKAAPAKPATASSSAERARAEAALANAPQFYVPVGAYADPAGVIAKLKGAKVAYFTEPVATEKGKVTRVRAGPYASREAAEKALKQLEKLGFKPGNIATRS